MRRLVLSLATALVIAATASPADAGPPAGLTSYGRIVWNLDALLHDTFGSRQVWENFTRGPVGNYSTKFIDEATSVPYVYTFANARSSQFRAARPRHPPQVGTYATGENVPVRVKGAYVSCGHDKWLYERSGQAFVGGNMWCSVGPIAP